MGTGERSAAPTWRQGSLEDKCMSSVPFRRAIQGQKCQAYFGHQVSVMTKCFVLYPQFGNMSLDVHHSYEPPRTSATRNLGNP